MFEYSADMKHAHVLMFYEHRASLTGGTETSPSFSLNSSETFVQIWRGGLRYKRP